MRLPLISLLSQLACSKKEPLNPNDWWKADDPVSYVKQVIRETDRQETWKITRAMNSVTNKPSTPAEAEKLKQACIAIIQHQAFSFEVKQAAHAILNRCYDGDETWKRELLPPDNFDCSTVTLPQQDYFIECGVKKDLEDGSSK